MKLALDICIYIFELITSYCFIAYNFDKKDDPKHKNILITAAIYIVSGIAFHFVDGASLNLIVDFVITFVFFRLCFEVKATTAAVYSITLNAVMFACELISIYFVSYILKIPTDSFRKSMPAYILLVIISKVLYFALAQFIAFIIKKFKYKGFSSSRFMPLFIFPILTIATAILFFQMSLKNGYSNTYNIIFVVLNTLMLVASIYIFIYYQMLSKSDAEANALRTENKINKTDEAYLEVLKHQNEEMHMLSHDTKNHFSAIANMENIDEIKEYVNNVMGNIQKYDIVQFTNNKILDLLLSKYTALSKSGNIKLFIEVKTANLQYLPDSDLSTIVNNLMDNAFESAKCSSRRCVEFSLRRVGNFDILTVANSCDNKPLNLDGKLISTKDSTESHGYGTKIIKKYADKHNAKYDWFYNDDERRFIASVVFDRVQNE